MIKIVHIINSLDQGGAEKMLYKIIKNSEGSQIKNIVFCLKNDGLISHDFRRIGVQVINLRLSNFYNLLTSLNYIFKLITEIQPMVVMSWLHVSDFIGTLIKIKFPDIKLIWNLRCCAPEIKILGFRSWFLMKLLSLFSKIPDYIIANSQLGLESHLICGYKPIGKKIIYNGFEIENNFNIEDNKEFRNEHNLKEEFVIGYIGKKSKIKGIDLFIKSAKIIKKHNKKIKFIFVGKDLTLNNKYLYNLLHKTNLLESSILLGEIKNVEKIVTNFDILAITSRSEGFPNTLGEAMSYSIPCVSTDVGDCKNIIGDTGIVVKSFKPEDIAEGWKKIYKMSFKKRTALGKKAKNRIANNFSIKKTVEDYKSLLLEITNEKR